MTHLPVTPKQALPPRIAVDNQLRPTTTSTGRLIHATEDGIRNFWRWYGSSVVSDEEGRPVVVYHGTANDFTSFDPRHSGRNYRSTGGQSGFFFTSSPVTASVYAEAQANAYLNPSFPEKVQFGDGTAHIMPVYINIHSPLVIRTQQYPDKYFDYQRDRIYARVNKYGADGIIVRGQGRDLYVAFRPEQIKSAVGNSGRFDPLSSSLCDDHPAPAVIARPDHARLLALDAAHAPQVNHEPRQGP